MKDKYTLLILPPENASTHQLQLSKKAVLVAFGGALILTLIVLGIVIGNINYASYIKNHKAEFAAVDSLKENLASKDKEILLLKSQNQEISQNLDALSKLETTISGALKLPPPAPLSAPSRGQVRSGANSNPETNLDLSQKYLARFQSYYSETRKLLEKQAHTPSIPPLQGEISSPFGYRTNPFGGRSSEFHHGLDIACAYGSEVHATAEGVVSFVGWDGEYGLKVELDHGNGFVTFYGHNSRLLVAKGDKVQKGQAISLSGTSGRSTGSHLHYGVLLSGKDVDPSQYMYGIKEP